MPRGSFCPYDLPCPHDSPRPHGWPCLVTRQHATCIANLHAITIKHALSLALVLVRPWMRRDENNHDRATEHAHTEYEKRGAECVLSRRAYIRTLSHSDVVRQSDVVVVLPMRRCSSGSVTREEQIELQVTPQYQRYGTHGAMRSRDSTDGSRMAGFGSGFGDRIRFFSRVRIRIGFGPARFGFGSVPPGQVRIRIGSAGPGSDSDRIRLRRFG